MHGKGLGDIGQALSLLGEALLLVAELLLGRQIGLGDDTDHASLAFQHASRPTATTVCVITSLTLY
ncbi:hypothetical protein ACIRVK_04830 [Streptomyces sp. NPDC101152]|uniref:hypothetical protein n=1 Tax=Streptomyces sp. NPDC101152 TaxID=3366116 RepID=UPI003815DFA4